MSATGQTWGDLGRTIFIETFARETAKMEAHEAGWFEPETVKLLEIALNEAWTALSAEQRAHTSRTEMAVRILKLARKGVLDPVRLRTGALIEVTRIQG